jgi:hypothetical protein
MLLRLRGGLALLATAAAARAAARACTAPAATPGASAALKAGQWLPPPPPGPSPPQPQPHLGPPGGGVPAGPDVECRDPKRRRWEASCQAPAWWDIGCGWLPSAARPPDTSPVVEQCDEKPPGPCPDADAGARLLRRRRVVTPCAPWPRSMESVGLAVPCARVRARHAVQRGGHGVQCARCTSQVARCRAILKPRSKTPFRNPNRNRARSQSNFRCCLGADWPHPPSRGKAHHSFPPISGSIQP